jgi:hypothetical protein
VARPPRGRTLPSPTDYEAWEAGFDQVNAKRREPFYVGIIAVPDERGKLAYPTFHGWATTRQNGGYVTRPAKLLAA